MEQLSARAKALLADVRRRSRLVDHIVRTVLHYYRVNGSMQAGAVTFYAFLSFFPILSLAFFCVGWVAQVFPDARHSLVVAIERLLPGMVSDQVPAPPGTLSLSSISDHAAAAGWIGLAGLLYSGVGWVSDMRSALQTIFVTPSQNIPTVVRRYLADLLVLIVIGALLVASVGLSGVVSSFSKEIMGWLGLDSELSWVLAFGTTAVGLAANYLVFMAMFRLLATPAVPKTALHSGALMGAVGFEVLKRLSTVLLESTKSTPGVQAFGVALILLIWINYFSRVVMYAGAWAYTAAAADTAHK